MVAFRPAVVKVRVYAGQEDLWTRFLRGEARLNFVPTGYKDGTEGEFTIREWRKDEPYLGPERDAISR